MPQIRHTVPFVSRYCVEENSWDGVSTLVNIGPGLTG